MPKKSELLSVEGTTAANDAFMRTYQRSILLSLEKEGWISAGELEACLFRLDILSGTDHQR